MAPLEFPQAWKAEDVRRDSSWIQRLTLEEARGFSQALSHAKQAGKPLLAMEQADFPLPPASRQALQRALDATQGRWGMVLVKGFPTDDWSESDMRIAYWGMSLYMGVGRTQNRASEVINDVRDTGGSYYVKGGRGYNTNVQLDFHQDYSDVVALLCRRTAKSGGTSKVVSSLALRHAMQEQRPDLMPALQGNSWFHSFQGAQDPTQPPYYRCPIFGTGTKISIARTNRKDTTAAQRDFPEVPRMSAQQTEALNILDELQPSNEFCYSMELERGDLQLLNNFVIWHSRTSFEDYDEPDQKRHLMRLWMSTPNSPELPPQFEEFFGDTRPGSVRGGVRGGFIKPDFLEYEQRQAAAMGMAFKPFRAVVSPEEMAKIIATS
ncbi:Clavaminate synthase-like protein [Polyplosphaeria fusca]|uniref:Clavaminate synthase-like protein n=1 Tax=Polyplosphaeria fusca TaxID=682080 RepID=A0A9P4QJ36_9PLEO|nr:Clavaminate synthase-like protein [Polyplosphaeria fusca]